MTRIAISISLVTCCKSQQNKGWFKLVSLIISVPIYSPSFHNRIVPSLLPEAMRLLLGFQVRLVMAWLSRRDLIEDHSYNTNL